MNCKLTSSTVLAHAIIAIAGVVIDEVSALIAV